MSIKAAKRSAKANVEQKHQLEARASEQKPKDYEPPPNDVPVSTYLKIEYAARNGAKYRAAVLFTVPTFDALLRIGQMQTMMSGTGLHYDVAALTVVRVMSYLIVCLDEKTLPSWWDDEGGRDFAPYQELYALAVAYEQKYFRGDTQEAALPVPAGDGVPVVRGSSDADQGAVGGQVPAATQRREILTPDPA